MAAAGTDPEQPTGRQVIEPTRIFRAGVKSGKDGDPPVDPWMEELDLFRPLVASAPPRVYNSADADTEEFETGLGTATEPPATAAEPEPEAEAPSRSRPRTAALAAAGAAGAALALALVLLLSGSEGSTAAPSDTGRGTSAPAAPTESAEPAAPTESASPAAPGGDGRRGQAPVLSLGDSGPEVSELQSRLLRIPDVYTGGAVNGRYDQSLASAVARFQLWYGIRGDEDGVYGDDTRRDLESRT